MEFDDETVGDTLFVCALVFVGALTMGMLALLVFFG
jgi:hypothetical protein